MKRICLAIVLAASAIAMSDPGNPLVVRYGKAVCGENVTVFVDGQAEHVFAGKLGFQDASRSWISVCGNIRAPITDGQFFVVHPQSTKTLGGRYEKAGNIVHKYFNQATTPIQCAALQIAVWEAIEVGSDEPDFYSGDFQVRADPGTMALATSYYENPGEGGDAFFLQAGSDAAGAGGGAAGAGGGAAGGGAGAAGGGAGAGGGGGGGAGGGVAAGGGAAGGQSQLSP